MGAKELCEKYQASKPRLAVNRAIRAELPGGNEVLDIIDVLQTTDCNHPVIDKLLTLAVDAHGKMSREIAVRYDLKSVRE